MNEVDNNLFEGCLNYKSLTDGDIHAAAWKDLEIMVLGTNKEEGVYYRINVLWYHISERKFVGASFETTLNMYHKLPQ